MTSSAVQSLPSARLLSAVMVMVAGGFHLAGWIPDREWLTPMAMAMPLVLVMGAVAARMAGRPMGPRGLMRPARAEPPEAGPPQAGRYFGSQRLMQALVVAARLGVSILVACVFIAWRVHAALDARLPAAVEGLDLEVVGVVDAMPQRFDFGDRVRFSLTSCRMAGAARSTGPAGAPASPSPCGGLARLQLDWGPLREKDRVDPGAAAVPETGAEPGLEPGPEPAPGPAPEPAPEPALGPAPETDDSWPRPGQHWRLIVRLKRPVAPANPGGFDLELRYLQQGIGALGRVYARQRLVSPPGVAGWQPGLGILVAFEARRTVLRDRLEAVFAHRVDPPAADRIGRWPLLGVVAGLALGDQGAISASLWGLFSRTGVSHLMAISGMHVTMLALVAAWLASWLLRLLAGLRVAARSRLLARHPRQVLVLAVAVLAAFGYALLSGWGIPAQRTCWMLSAAALMSWSGRGRGALDITLSAAAVVVIADPWAVSTAGFWLSFGAVAAILWCAHGRDSERALRMTFLGVGSARIPAAVRDAMTSQWAATIGLAPLVIALFSTLSLIGPIANAAAIPWVSLLVTPLAVAAALSAPLSEPLAALLLGVDLWLIEHLIALLSHLDRAPLASVAVPRPATWTLLAAALGATALIAPAGVPMRPAGALCLLPMLFAPPHVPPADELWVTVLDIGQGSTVLVETAGTRLLFDAGSGSGADNSAASRFLVPYLRTRGIETIDTLVISHLDSQHAGGAAAVLQALRPMRLLTSFDAGLLRAEPRALAAVKQLPCVAGRRFELGRATVEVLHPPAVVRLRRAAGDNASSCVVRIASAAGSVLLAGDLPGSAEPSLVRASDAGSAQAGRAQAGRAQALRSDVLIVPQQGSRHAATPLLLAAVRPSIAVLQVGYRNRHRHPHPAVLQRLFAAGALVLRTDHDGAVQIRLRAGGPPQVHRIRRDAPPYWRIDSAATAPSSPRRQPRRRPAPGRPPANRGTPPARRSAPA